MKPLAGKHEWFCSLWAANAEGRRATPADLIFRCQNLLCPACSTYIMRKPLKRAAAVNKRWDLPSLAATVNLATVSKHNLSRSLLASYEQAANLVEELKSRDFVLGVALKLEVAAGRRSHSLKSQPLLIHLHLQTLLDPLNPAARIHLRERLRFLSTDIQTEDSDEGWLSYFEKVPTDLERKRENLDPSLLPVLRRAYAKLEQRGAKRLLWLGGLYDGRVERWAIQGVTEYLKARADGRKPKPSRAVDKWKRLAPFFKHSIPRTVMNTRCSAVRQPEVKRYDYCASPVHIHDHDSDSPLSMSSASTAPHDSSRSISKRSIRRSKRRLRHPRRLRKGGDLDSL